MEDLHIFILQNCIKLIVSHTSCPHTLVVVSYYRFFVVALLFMGNMAHAQEKQDSQFDDSHGVIQNLGGHLMNVFKEAETVKDSTLSKSSLFTEAKAEQQSSDTKPEEETLSFNFLYFIIQKFKVTDIID